VERLGFRNRTGDKPHPVVVGFGCQTVEIETLDDFGDEATGQAASSEGWW
jgi:hypothetical protein